MVEVKNFKITTAQNSSVIQFYCEKENIKPLIPVRIKTGELANTLSVSQFAKEAGVTPQAVRKMISEGRLNAKKLGEQYVISLEELSRYLQIK